MASTRSALIRLASNLEKGSQARRDLLNLVAERKTAMEHATEDALKKYLKEHPNADKSKHTVKGEGGGEGEKKELDPKLKKLISEYRGDIPDYKLEIIAGEDGDITESDLRRAKAVKAQLKRGIQAAADVCKMSPPVCEGNFGVARSSMPQLSADEPIKDMLKSDEDRIKDMGKAWDELSDAKKEKSKRGWAIDRKKGEAAVKAGADPDDDRTVFQQLLDGVAEEGVKISSQKPPYDKREVGKLKATQREIKAGKTYGIANAYLEGKYDPRESPIIISSDNHILDGHHRYSAMITADPEAKMNVIVVDMPMKKFLERSFEQPGVFRADLQDNIISNDDPLDLARENGSTWKQGDKFYAKNNDGDSSGPFKSEDAAKDYASGKKKEASMTPADRTSLIRLASSLEKGNPLRRAILAGCEKLPAGPMRDNCEKKSKAKKDDDKKEKKAGKGKVPDALKKHQFKPGEGKGEDADGDGKTNEKKPDFLKKKSSMKKKIERHMFVIHKAGDRYVVTLGDPRKPGVKVRMRSPHKSDVTEYLEDIGVSKDGIFDMTREFGIPDTYSDFYMRMKRLGSDRKSLTRLAASLPKGSSERRALLAIIK